MFVSLPGVFAREAFDFHVMPEKLHWKDHVSGLAIFKQYLDSLIPLFDAIVGYYPFHVVYLISLWRHSVCFENGFEVFL